MMISLTLSQLLLFNVMIVIVLSFIFLYYGFFFLIFVSLARVCTLTITQD